MKRGDQIRLAYRLLACLSRARRGLRSVQLAEELEISRATVNRYLTLLRDSGIPILRERINGEVRHRLASADLPPLQLTFGQALALRLARDQLRPLDGTELVRELDTLLESLPGDLAPDRAARPDRALSYRAPAAASAKVVYTIDAALRARRQLEIHYRAASHGGEARRYRIEPLRLRLVGDSLYLAAYVPERHGPRTFKVIRIEQVRMLDTLARPHPELTDQVLFQRAVKIWNGEPVDVIVRLTSQVAHLASEYPLVADQILKPASNGDVFVRARVAGLVEVRSWVLSWGSAAEALAPQTLRDTVRDDLTAALAPYMKNPARRSGPQERSELVSDEEELPAGRSGDERRRKADQRSSSLSGDDPQS